MNTPAGALLLPRLIADGLMNFAFENSINHWDPAQGVSG
ncbi:Uncharacterised protein [Pseudomonas fluorescens]|uniref:Uncharacterized protein n=1 Tax=Pseudomonas fluorescens TaxID=294 RepID=A0A379IE14_PSEFL|nr:Uncharacterised protein [Pseudomonas fluorescens]